VSVTAPRWSEALHVLRAPHPLLLRANRKTATRRSARKCFAAALERAFQPNTRLIYINIQHNPTGLMMPREVLDRVIELCTARNAWLAEEP